MLVFLQQNLAPHLSFLRISRTRKTAGGGQSCLAGQRQELSRSNSPNAAGYMQESQPSPTHPGLLVQDTPSLGI